LRQRLCCRRVEAGRLVYYRAAADAAFWEAHWRGSLTRDSYVGVLRGHLGPLDGAVRRHLRPGGRVLEAGCGLAQYVVGFRARGYAAEGVDWAAETIGEVRRLFPDLPLRTGDVMALDVPDGTYAGYVSLGVAEHFREGPQAVLREAWRVLEPGGIALVSVPWFNGLRRRLARAGCYRQDPGSLPFYQYAYTEGEFAAHLGACGFEILERTSYDPMKTLRDELPLVARVLRWPLLGKPWRVFILGILAHGQYIERSLGHMVLFVARKGGAR
jgi:SAM-dependent methyltransferase